MDVVEGRQRKEASLREWMQSWIYLRFCEADVVEGRQRKVASLREWMQSWIYLRF